MLPRISGTPGSPALAAAPASPRRAETSPGRPSLPGAWPSALHPRPPQPDAASSSLAPRATLPQHPPSPTPSKDDAARLLPRLPGEPRIGHAHRLRERWPQLPLTDISDISGVTVSYLRKDSALGVSESNPRVDAALGEVPDHVLAMRQHLRGPKENGQHYARRLREAFPDARLEDIALAAEVLVSNLRKDPAFAEIPPELLAIRQSHPKGPRENKHDYGDRLAQILPHLSVKELSLISGATVQKLALRLKRPAPPAVKRSETSRSVRLRVDPGLNDMERLLAAKHWMVSGAMARMRGTGMSLSDAAQQAGLSAEALGRVSDGQGRLHPPLVLAPLLQSAPADTRLAMLVDYLRKAEAGPAWPAAPAAAARTAAASAPSSSSRPGASAPRENRLPWRTELQVPATASSSAPAAHPSEAVRDTGLRLEPDLNDMAQLLAAKHWMVAGTMARMRSTGMPLKDAARQAGMSAEALGKVSDDRGWLHSSSVLAPLLQAAGADAGLEALIDYLHKAEAPPAAAETPSEGFAAELEAALQTPAATPTAAATSPAPQLQAWGLRRHRTPRPAPDRYEGPDEALRMLDDLPAELEAPVLAASPDDPMWIGLGDPGSPQPGDLDNLFDPPAEFFAHARPPRNPAGGGGQ
ncbi:hypothetical protein [Rhizobacter sp. Root1221]|uniref:hypothetical protein n=1 Tax=Rhizobacter sp. Root1221 TaxID=1736433 RepID=UPI000AEBC092|nr:hypothetical protein [Rhizobacter sp. Root1221]